MMDLTTIILTYNEALHIRRAIESALQVSSRILIVDSFSTDETVQIATEMGAIVLQNKFINYARQFQWGLDNGDINTAWVMRMDADEYLTPEAIKEINEKIYSLSTDITGIILKRRVHFMGQWIRHGGYYPIKLLRIWRNRQAVIEQKWMDEHMVLLNGNTIEMAHDIVDDNLNSLTWWTDKHNTYATREAVDILNQKYNFLQQNSEKEKPTKTKQADVKRWFKKNVYGNLPLLARSMFYFLFRYFLKLGFLDGRRGLIWHFLQGFWYRFLVDAKVYQILYLAKKENKSVSEIIEQRFKYKLNG